MHQFDLLYMPSDTLYGNKYKYILAGIDDASRYKVARPLRTKQVRLMSSMAWVKRCYSEKSKNLNKLLVFEALYP